MTELFEYVRIGQNNEGYALVEVCHKDRKTAVKIFLDTIEELANCEGILTAFPQLKIEMTNANKDRVPMVTVKGDEHLNPTEKFIEEKVKVATE